MPPREIDRVLAEYERRFNDTFPSMNFTIRDDEHFIKLVQDCLDADVPAGKFYGFDKQMEENPGIRY